jgi:hypothetical protein
VRDGADGVAASKATWFWCSGFVRLDDMAVGAISVIDGLGDTSMMVRGLVWMLESTRRNFLSPAS